MLFLFLPEGHHVRYFNAQRQRTGTIWEGRFKSCLVDSDHYLFALYEYIEMNPIKAGMVEDLKDYQWSSYLHNALGQADPLITEHGRYQALGTNTRQRSAGYLNLFGRLNSSVRDTAITEATMRGEVYGSKAFHHKISALVSRATKLTSHGGDRKSEAYHNQAG